MKRDFVVVLVTITLIGIFGISTNNPPVQGQQVTTGPPVVQNGSLNTTAPTTVLPGVGRGYIVWTLTNESTQAGLRCTYGGTSGEPPAQMPTTRTGSLINAGVSLTERTAPSNRLECIAVSGNVDYDITLYPK